MIPVSSPVLFLILNLPFHSQPSVLPSTLVSTWMIFFFYSTSLAEEELFQRMLAKHIQVDFMGDVEYFLGTAFTFLRHFDGNLSVHLSQSAFTEFTAHRFGVNKMNKTPNIMTPYRSGYQIDSIPAADPDDPSLAHRTKVCQSIVGCIN